MQHAIIFVRVSKKEQDYHRQVEDLRVVAKNQSVQVVAEISEKISGVRTNQERDGIQQLLLLCRQGAVEKVLVCEVSRLGRSTVEVLQVVDELTRLGISIYPGRRAVQNFGRCAVAIQTLKDGKRNPVAQFLFTLLAEFARLERETLRERILSGMDEARRQGKKIGRPEGKTEEKTAFLKKYAPVIRNLRAGLSVRKTAKLCDVSINTVRKVNLILKP